MKCARSSAISIVLPVRFHVSRPRTGEDRSGRRRVSRGMWYRAVFGRICMHCIRSYWCGFGLSGGCSVFALMRELLHTLALASDSGPAASRESIRSPAGAVWYFGNGLPRGVSLHPHDLALRPPPAGLPTSPLKAVAPVEVLPPLASWPWHVCYLELGCWQCWQCWCCRFGKRAAARGSSLSKRNTVIRHPVRSKTVAFGDAWLAP